ncbi:MAG: T9SS type A sorting domain-containing protein [Draconibacterium sp.]
MKSLNKTLKGFSHLFILLVFSGTVLAQTSNGTGGGDATQPSTWSTGIVPALFGGTGTGAATIAAGDVVTYGQALTVGQNQSLTVNAGATFIGTEITASKGTITLNGTLIGIGQLKFTGGGSMTGSGTLYVLSTSGSANTIPGSITQYVAFNTWTGANGTTWADNSNWSSGTYPQSTTDRAFIDPSAPLQPVIASNISIEAVIVGDGASLTINPTGSLTTSAGVINRGAVNIQSNTSNSGNLITAETTGDGTFNVQRYLPTSGAGKWHVISSPVNESLGNFVNTNSFLRTNPENSVFALGSYNETNGTWEDYYTPVNTNNFGVAKGYIVGPSSPGAVTFSGSTINTGAITANVDSSLWGWNAIGNPYTSSILASGTGSFLEVNLASLSSGYEAIYMWDAANNEYAVIAQTGYTFGVPGGETSLSQSEIAVGQGFMIKVASGVSSLSFAPTMQTADPAVAFKSGEIPAPALRLSVNAGELSNQTIVGFRPGMSDGWDKGYDLGKLKGNDNIALYTKLVDRSSTIDFAIQSLEDISFDQQRIPVGLDLKTGTEVTFTLKTINFPEEAKVFIVDKELGFKTLISSEETSYKVTLPASSGADRFELSVENFKSAQIPTDIDLTTASKLKIFSGNGKIIIDGTVSSKAQFAVYGMDGKLMTKSMATNSNRNEINVQNCPDGIYIVRIEDAGKLQTNKIIINKQ